VAEGFGRRSRGAIEPIVIVFVGERVCCCGGWNCENDGGYIVGLVYRNGGFFSI